MLLFKNELLFLKQNYSIIKRSFSHTSNTFLMQYLKQRSLLQLTGKDAGTFLQGLITNDIRHLNEGSLSMFTMFLNSKGRVLYESIIYNNKNDNSFFIECDSLALSSLKEHILAYKVRRKINVDSLENQFNVWAVIDKIQFQKLSKTYDYKSILNLLQQKLPDCIITHDPRLSLLGLRILAPQSLDIIEEIKKVGNLNVEEDDFYDSLRYKLGIGEGLKELPPEKCFPMEMNGDYLHGISFHKGCYIGQELTARTYHTGVIRKRLMPLVFDQDIQITDIGIPIFPVPQTNKPIGKLHGVKKNIGVGLLRIEEALKAEELQILDNKCITQKPSWWPAEAPKKRRDDFNLQD